MTVTAFRLTNFMAFGEWPNEDDGWIELRPITLLFGRNSSGKSTVLRALRFLRQSLGGGPNGSPFVYSSRDGVDVGSFMELVNQGGGWRQGPNPYAYDDDTGASRRLGFDFRVQIPEDELSFFPGNDLLSDKQKTVELRLGYAWSLGAQSGVATLVTLAVILKSSRQDESDSTLFEAERLPLLPDDVEGPLEWFFGSDSLPALDYSKVDNIWPSLRLEGLNGGFLPQLYVPVALRRFETDEIAAVRTLLDKLTGRISQFLNGIEHIRPLRPEPKRRLTLDEEEHTRWQAQGRGAYLRFIRGDDVDGNQLRQLSRWMDALELGAQVGSDIKWKDTGSVVSAVVVVEKGASTGEVNLVDVGYGASQVIPILAQLVLAPSGSLTMIEQPELHLHPQAQAAFGDLFIESIRESQRYLLIETHSEHLILRLQKRIRHDEFQPDEMIVFYTTRKNGRSFLHRLNINEKGDFIEAWPEGFFPERFDEIFD